MEEINQFEIASFSQLENYIKNFNQTVKELGINEVDILRNFDGSGLYQLSNDDQVILKSRIKKACLRKHGPVSEFEAEPTFLIVLKCFIDLIADKWSKS